MQRVRWQVLVVDTEDVDPEGHEFAVLRTELTDGIGAAGFDEDTAWPAGE